MSSIIYIEQLCSWHLGWSYHSFFNFSLNSALKSFSLSFVTLCSPTANTRLFSIRLAYLCSPNCSTFHFWWSWGLSWNLKWHLAHWADTLSSSHLMCFLFRVIKWVACRFSQPLYVPQAEQTPPLFFLIYSENRRSVGVVLILKNLGRNFVGMVFKYVQK